MPNRNQMVEAIKTYCRAETEKDKIAWLSLFAEEIVHEDPVGVTTRRGKAELESLWALVVAGNAHLRLTEEVIVCGHEAAAIMACQSGPPEAPRKTEPIVDLFVFNEAGKITQVRAFYKW